MLPLYHILTLAGSAIVVPAMHLKAAADPASRGRLRERLGKLDPWSASPGGRSIRGKRLWLQAVSVGEVRVAETLLRALREAHPSLCVALSSTTSAGLASASRLTGSGPEPAGLADRKFAFPLDLPWVVNRVLERLAPSAYGSVETEIWPGLLCACRSRGIPALLVNGSLSARSAKRLGWAGGAVREGLGALRAACVQTAGDAERLERLGAPRGALVVTGNLKFDGGGPGIESRVAALRREMAIPEKAPVLVAGSTSHGEEAIILDAFNSISARLPSARLLLAPRHPDRFEEVAALVRASGLPASRRSAGAALPAGTGGVILLDTLGELEAAYGIASVAFVGGSLVPRGGQNPIEPARLGVPVLFGPGMDNFREVAADLLACGGAFEVRGGSDLSARALELMTRQTAREPAGEAGRRLVASHAGATRRTLEALERLIPDLFA